VEEGLVFAVTLPRGSLSILTNSDLNPPISAAQRERPKNVSPALSRGVDEIQDSEVKLVFPDCRDLHIKRPFAPVALCVVSEH
jgi:hypothetical protein